jgi:hypothetical protein
MRHTTRHRRFRLMAAAAASVTAAAGAALSDGA